MGNVCPLCEEESAKVYRCTNDDCPKGAFTEEKQTVRRRA